MTHIEDLLLQSISLEDARYVFGAEADFDDPHPSTVDCSELIEWAANSLVPPVTPRFPDGSWLQYRHCWAHECGRPVEFAQETRGALLFRFSRDPLHGSRPPASHVAWSLGDGSTLEARGAAYGVGSWTSSASRGWTHGAIVPGVDYTSSRPSFRELSYRHPLMNGTDVADLQERLIIAGHGSRIRVPVDGVFGMATRGALIEWQFEVGLSPDGVYGPLSRMLGP